MRERAFNARAHEVRAILAGRQSQFRRIVDPRIHVAIGHDWEENPDRIVEQSDPEFGAACLKYVPCPYGQRGDRLWVRETFVYRSKYDRYYYRADHPQFDPYAHNGWKPSIHMPRRASRITLEVTGVRVERLQAITEEDARAEGVELLGSSVDASQRICGDSAAGRDRTYGTHPYTVSFAVLWDTINEARAPWISNPWVWVVEFQRVEAERRAA